MFVVYGGGVGDYVDDFGDGDFCLVDFGMDCGVGCGLFV